jgi:hypothetical protein
VTSVLDRPRVVQREQKEPENAKQSNQLQVCYGSIPMVLIRPVPMVRFRDGDERERLTPFEMTIAAAISAAARGSLVGQRHAQAFQRGGEQIRWEQELDDNFRQEWRDTNEQRRHGKLVGAPVRKHTYDHDYDHATYKPDKLKVALRKAGEHGYREAKRELQQERVPDRITVSLSMSQLLDMSGLRITGSNFRQLDAALKRLAAPVNKMAPLLPCCRYDHGRLRLVVNGGWLNPPYLRVPLPLPPASHATALLLFLLSVRAVPSNSKSTRFTKLLDLLGIDPHNRQRDLTRAIKQVNDYLAGIPDSVADQLYAHKIRLPASYHTQGGRFIRFVGVSRPTPEKRAEQQHREEVRTLSKGAVAELAQVQDDIERQRQEADRQREAFEATRRRYLQGARQ